MSSLKNHCLIGLFLALAASVCSAQQAFQLHDVALNHDGVLVGQMVDANGTPAAGAAFTIAKKGQPAMSVTTRENGKFVVSGLSGGHYQVVSAQGANNFRLWADGTAPKNAMKGMLLVASKEVARGQCETCTDGAVPCDSCTTTGCGCGGSGCSSCGGGIGGKGLVAALGVGLAVWAIVELADDEDAPAS